jgi:hypothetical protein
MLDTCRKDSGTSLLNANMVLEEKQLQLAKAQEQAGRDSEGEFRVTAKAIQQEQKNSQESVLKCRSEGPSARDSDSLGLKRSPEPTRPTGSSSKQEIHK